MKVGTPGFRIAYRNIGRRNHWDVLFLLSHEERTFSYACKQRSTRREDLDVQWRIDRSIIRTNSDKHLEDNFDESRPQGTCEYFTLGGVEESQMVQHRHEKGVKRFGKDALEIR